MTPQEIKEAFATFDEDKRSLIISSTSIENEPLTSYAPFVKKRRKILCEYQLKSPTFYKYE